MNDLEPRISIIYPSYNGEPYLIKNLDSICNLINLKEIELIIIDNNSSDFSINLIESYKKKINLTLIKLKNNIGFAKACNIGASKAKGDFIFITNQDTVFPSNFFLILLEIYQKYKKEKDIIISPALVFNSNKIHYFGAKNHFLGFSYTPQIAQNLPNKRMVKRTKRFSGATLFIKRGLFFDLGGFDPSFFMYCEDTDLSLRALRRGIPIYTTNHTILTHQKNEWYLSDFQYFLLERNRIITFLKNLEEINKLFPLFILTEIILIIHSIAINKFKIRIAIYSDLLNNIKFLKQIRITSKNKSEFMSYRLFSKTLDPILLGKLNRFQAFKSFLKMLNIILRLI